MRGRDVQAELFDEPRQPRSLALREVENQAGEGRRVDDRVLERTFESPTDEPRIERVVAVLDQDGALREPQEGSARVAKLWRADEHRAVNVVAAPRIRIDRGAAVDERVEEGEGGVQPEAFGADLQDQEGSIPRGLHVEGDELSILEPGLRSKLWRVDGDLLPGHRTGGAARLEEEGLHVLRITAARTNRNSSVVTARRTSRATR